jgi:hypothetical protein
MIIDDEHRVAFVHIPKCGGTSVRRQLEALDSYQGFFYDRREHAELGRLDYCHIPLSFLAEHFPEAYEKVATYRAFALVRDPHSRFVSATFERLALFGGVRRTAATAHDAISEAERTIDWLADRGPFSDPAYIHFARQIDYVTLDGRRIVDNVYAIEDMAGFGAELERLTGARFDPGRRENTNFASPNRWLSLLHVAKPLYSRVTSWKQREAILKVLHRWKLQSPDALYEAFRRNPRITAFVESYYAEDLPLYEEAKARMAGRRDAPNKVSPAAMTT